MTKKILSAMLLGGLFFPVFGQTVVVEPDELPRPDEIETEVSGWFDLKNLPEIEFYRFDLLNRNDADSLIKYRYLLGTDPDIPLPEGTRRWLSNLEQNDAGLFKEPGITNYTFSSRIQMKSHAQGMDESRVWNRLLLHNKTGWEAGVIHEKDPKEQWNDYTAGFLMVRLKWPFNSSVIAGDYRIRTGLGLLYGDLFPPMKGNTLVSLPAAGTPEIKPFRSSIEYGGLRGVAVTGTFAGLSVLIAGSHRTLDGSGYQTNTDGDFYLINPVFTGIHVSDSELMRRNAILDTRLITAISGSWGDFTSGLVFSMNKQSLNNNDVDLEPVTGMSDYRAGKSQQGSCYFAWKNETTSWATELASDGKGASLISGLESKLTDGIHLSTVFRRLNLETNTWFSGPFSHGDPLKNNETGLYSGMKLRFGIVQMVVYTDHWTFIQPDTETGFRSSGSEFALHGALIPNQQRSVSTGIKFFLKRDQTEKMTGRKFKIQADQITGNGIHFRVRWDEIRMSQMGYGDAVTFRMGINDGGTLSSKQQISVFSCNDADARPFVTEPELPGLLYFHAFYHQGWRFSQEISWNPSTLISFSVKWGLTEITKILNPASSVKKGTVGEWSLQWELKP